MQPIPLASRSHTVGVLFVAVLCAAARFGFAAEVTVKNDSLSGGDQGNMQLGFVAGERAAAWLTSPCNGDIVAVQVFWRSLFGGEPQSLEDSITIYNAGVFPAPGTVLATIIGPVMTDGVINEFRFLNDPPTIPLSVPVTSGQTIIVAFEFLENPPALGPTVVTDIGNILPNRNAIFAVPGGWLSASSVGITGDFVIRAVVDCEETQSCCFLPTGCLNLTAGECGIAGGFPQGPGTSCGVTVCFPTGACCNPDGTCDDDVDDQDCLASGGLYQGDESLCSGVQCPAPDGACCLSNGNCLVLTEAECGVIPGSSWAGALTPCPQACEAGACQTDDDCDDDNACTQDDCVLAACTYTARLFGDVNNDGTADIFDILCVLDGFAGVFNPPCTASNLDLSPCAGDGVIDIFDILGVLDGFAGNNICGCA
ncbi:MAG: hypothetical protein HOP29_19745 [Phycisphaerales bacterium]|nr:hypothetical protein [Phycisphaerales bacterium]